MKVRIPKNWDPLGDSFVLTKADIEQQVSNDLGRFHSEYGQKFGVAPSEILDVETFVSVLWGFAVVYEEIEQVAGEETLGTLRPETQNVVVDSRCIHHGRLSFTIAHEVGHLSLHGPLFRRENNKIIGELFHALQKGLPDSRALRKLFLLIEY